MNASTSATSFDPSTLAALFRQVRDRTESLAAPLGAEDQVVQSMPDVSPTKWHRAHTTWFFEAFVLSPHVPGYESVDPAYGYLFNSYYEGVGPRHARHQRGLISRPTVADVGRYRESVDGAVHDGLTSGTIPSSALGLVELGLHHEQQHQELLLMDIKHVLGSNPLGPTYLEGCADGSDEPDDASGGAGGWRSHPGGIVPVGHDGHGFSFDNEAPRHDVLLHPFEVADRLVSAGDWIDFIADGGYRRAELWLSDGWHTVNDQGWDAPMYWRRGDARWELFTLGGWRPVTRDEPVCHVSYYEADAYANWAGARLPTEFEWEAIAVDRIDRARADASADTPFHPRSGAAGSFDRQVWQWTSSAYLPYPGFRAAPGAVGEYNGKFMVNQQVLRGGACVTPPGHSRPTYRNFFPAAARWPFSGVRLARDA